MSAVKTRLREPPQIRLRGLRKRFGPRTALTEIDLEIGGTAIVGILGPDGAGKTTLLRAIGGLLEIEADEAAVLGHDLRADVTALKAEIGYVPQVFSLHRDLSVMENLRFTAKLHRLDPEEFEKRAFDLLERTGLRPFGDRAAGALSGGMKQKLSIANALLPEPQLLLLDEPTAGVDVLARGEIWTMLERERSRALVLLSTSYLDEAAACDRLIVLDRGRVVASGTPTELSGAAALEIYRAWGDDARAIAREAKQLAYVGSARATGSYARIETERSHAPSAEQVLRDLRQLPSARVRFAERAPIDLESMLLALARGEASLR